jgi:hypothetical protein
VSKLSLEEMSPLFAFKLEDAVSALCPGPDQETTSRRIKITRSISERQEQLIPGARWPAEQVGWAANLRGCGSSCAAACVVAGWCLLDCLRHQSVLWWLVHQGSAWGTCITQEVPALCIAVT